MSHLSRTHLALPIIMLAGVLVLSGCDTSTKRTGTSDFDVEVADCFADPGQSPTPCSKPHQAQTVYVSHQRVTDSARAARPCHAAQASFLGADVNTRLDVQLWVASDRSWSRCDVLLRKSTRAGSAFENITGSLRKTLAAGVPVHLQACLGTRYRPARDQPYVSCAERHVAQELTIAPAIGVLKEPFPEDIAERARNACNASASASGLMSKHRSVHAFYPKTEATWVAGQRTALCWVSGKRSSPLPAVS
jgi:Septum formation